MLQNDIGDISAQLILGQNLTFQLDRVSHF